MRRALIIVVSVMFSGAAIFIAAYYISMRLSVNHLSRQADDLDWLRREFRLGEAEMKRVRELHAGYLPQCRDMCDRIARKQQELEALLAGATNVQDSIEKKLLEVAALRAQCQAQMLRHFYAVSQTMPPEPGRRYLAEMQRLTLGFHEQVEQRMTGDSSSAHGHH